MAVPKPPNGSGTEWLKFVSAVLNLLLIPLTIWAINVEIRLTKIESNRYTAADAVVDARLIDEKLQRHEDISAHPIAAVVTTQLEDAVSRLERIHGIE